MRQGDGPPRVADVDEGNVDDVFRVCSHGRLDDPLQRRGIELKRRWLLEMLEERGPCTKIAYLEDKPVAQILFYPEEAIASISEPRKGVIVLHCAYNPFPPARGRGAGTALLRSLIDECRAGLPCLGGRPCRSIAARPFATGVGVPLAEFYAANGFENAVGEMFLEVTSPHQPRRRAEYRPLPEDRGRAVVLYNRMCEWSYPFAVQVKELIGEIDQTLPVQLIDEWRRPGESLRRGNQRLVVNAKPIRSFWTQLEEFQREVKEALCR